MKKISFAVALLLLISIPKMSNASEMSICTGSGASCKVTVVFNGQSVTITSEKTKGSASVVIK